jgi:hypothetical protein
MICRASEPPADDKEGCMTYKSDEEIRNDALFQLDRTIFKLLDVRQLRLLPLCRC